MPDFAFLPRADAPLGAPPATPDETLQESRIRDTLATGWPPRSTNPDVVLHGDYWPGNALWLDGVVTSVVDWEDARIGDALADVANCRLELTMLVGSDAATGFTNAYSASADIDLSNLPWWDLRAALRVCGRLESFGLDPDTEVQVRRRHRAFVDDAMRSAGVGS
jgi:Ser/Thr protein kinase RdoA (MazF antagonist)